jgi:hypothetical protein
MTQGLTIRRSRSQLLTSYAPGTFFAYEGGTGSYRVYPVGVPEADISRETAAQILERVQEAANSWFERTRGVREADPANPVTPEMCVDDILLNRERNGIRTDLPAKLALVAPKLMGYQPEPWTMVNTKCGLVRTYKDLVTMHGELDVLQSRECPHPKGRGVACNHAGAETLPCTWRQLDVMFIHCSGNAVGAMPDRYNWSDARGDVVLSPYTCICGCRDAVLKKGSPRIGHWYFACAKCGNTDKRWLQNDRVTMLNIRGQTGDRIREVRMEPVSFRANGVTYPQTDRIIDFPGQDILKLINDEGKLTEVIAETFDYPCRETTLADIEVVLAPYPEEAQDLEKYKKNLEFIEKYKDEEDLQVAVDSAREVCETRRRKWLEKRYIQPDYDIPLGIRENMAARAFVPSKFDPFRLFAEHRSLENEVLHGGDMGGGKRHFVPFDSPDEDLKHEPLEQSPGLANTLLGRMGVSRMGLIRRFKLCFFSYGFTRRHPTPILTNNNGQDLPVRLNLFDKITVSESRKNPVYVLKQENEAIYVRLDEETVRSYLLSLDCQNGKAFETGPVGSRLLENMFSMSMFLDDLPGTGPAPHPYLAVYTLLHTMAHHVIHAVAEYSGLDLGSLGEYLFPADLAFVVYRNGMTMDLGNLSAMWRNQGRVFLEHLLSPKALSCGLGMLCANKGGACPDCIMVPEVSCIAGNRLLSRSILKGQGMPVEGGFTEAIDGYFKTAGDMAAAGGSTSP